MAKPLTNLMQTYCRGLAALTDSQGAPLLQYMALAAIQSRRHTMYMYPFEQTISPPAFYLRHAEYELDKFCGHFPASINQHGYHGHDMLNVRLSCTFDFSNIQTDKQSIPVHITIRLDEITKRTETSPFFTSLETAHHHTAFASTISLNLNPEEVAQAQHPIQPWYADLPDLNTRSQAFERLLAPTLPHPERIQSHEPLRFPCQCCGFPTMVSVDNYDDCPLCDWGGDEAHLGANISSALDIARENFVLFANMNDTHDDTMQENITAKRKLVQAYLGQL